MEDQYVYGYSKEGLKWTIIPFILKVEIRKV